MSGAPSLVLIGIDGGTFDLIDPWVREGRLPAFEWLLGGARGELASTHPPLTPVAWSSMLTGCDPGQHRSWGFLNLGFDYEPEFLNGGSLPLPTLFELLSDSGMRVGTLNLPWTWPPRAVNGWWLSGLDAPAFNRDIAHPAGLFEELQRHFGGYFPRNVPPKRDGYALDLLEEQVTMTGAMARYLAAEHPVDLLAVAFVSTDHVQHWFWRDRAITARDGRLLDDLLLYTYELVDREIARIIEETAGPRTTVLLVSDHGAGPAEGGINLARWLAGGGWLHPRDVGAGGLVRKSALRLGARWLPAAVRERLRGRLGSTRRTMLSSLLRDGIEWERTSAFCWSDYGSISLNEEGRFSAGCVSKSRTEPLLSELAEALMAIRHPETGERVMSAPLRPAEIYQCAEAGAGPDLLAIPRGYRWEILSDFTPYGPIHDDGSEGIFRPALRQATHRLHGILAARGPGLRSDFRLAGARIEDITPTILHLLGERVPSYMDGRVLCEMVDPRRRMNRPPERENMDPAGVRAGGGYSALEAEAIERDLHGLGYL